MYYHFFETEDYCTKIKMMTWHRELKKADPDDKLVIHSFSANGNYFFTFMMEWMYEFRVSFSSFFSNFFSIFFQIFLDFCEFYRN